MVLHGQHDGIPFGHVGDKQGVYVFEVQDQGVIIGGFDFFDAAKKFGMRIYRTLGLGPFDIPFGDLGIESLAVVKLDTLAYGKCIDFAIGSNFPFGGQTGNEITVTVHLYQAFINISVYHPVNGGGGVPCGIQPRGFRRLANHQASAFLRGFGKRPLNGNNQS